MGAIGKGKSESIYIERESLGRAYREKLDEKKREKGKRGETDKN